MAIEIERKFLVTGDGWRAHVLRTSSLRQAYLGRGEHSSVRVRIRDGVRAALTIKSANSGSTREEFEYEIPVVDAERLIALRDGAAIEKTRHDVRVGGHLWEVDIFEGDNSGLVIAEIELSHAEERVELPDWVGEEVTGERRYYNSSLVAEPFGSWPKS